MAVNVSGTVLASLFYENCSSTGDQVGFLIGEIARHVRDTISDSQINNVEVKTRIYVFECVPCPNDQLFFNARGDIDRQKLSSLFPDKHKNIIGWYSFRRNSTLRPSFRERLLHQNLAGLVSEDSSLFLFLLCSSRATTNRSTHTLEHSFLHCDTGTNIFKKMPVDILNLGDMTHAEYRCSASHTVGSQQGAFRKIIQQQEKQFLNAQGQMEIQKVQVLNSALSSQLQKLSNAVSGTEARCSDLELEVAQYRRRAKLKQLEAKQKELQKLSNVKVEKGPSLDDILKMEESDSMPMDSLIDQEKLKQSSHDINSASVKVEEDKMEVEETGGKSDRKSDDHRKVLLSPAVALHSRSTSSPVDTPNVSSQPQTRHTRSKSSDNIGDVHSKSENTKADPRDPFGDLVNLTKEHNLRGKASVSQKGKTESDCIAMESETAGNKTVRSSSRQTGAARSAAHALNLKTRTTRSQKNADQMQDMDEMASLHESEESRRNTKDSRKINGGTKVFGGGGRQTDVLIIDTDESSTSQGTYDVDMSASPVY